MWSELFIYFIVILLNRSPALTHLPLSSQTPPNSHKAKCIREQVSEIFHNC